jgi:hypothetical protein
VCVLKECAQLSKTGRRILYRVCNTDSGPYDNEPVQINCSKSHFVDQVTTQGVARLVALDQPLFIEHTQNNSAAIAFELWQGDRALLFLDFSDFLKSEC